MYGGDLLQFSSEEGTPVSTQIFRRNGEWELINTKQFTSYFEVKVHEEIIKAPVVGFIDRVGRACVHTLIC